MIGIGEYGFAIACFVAAFIVIAIHILFIAGASKPLKVVGCICAGIAITVFIVIAYNKAISSSSWSSLSRRSTPSPTVLVAQPPSPSVTVATPTPILAPTLAYKSVTQGAGERKESRLRVVGYVLMPLTVNQPVVVDVRVLNDGAETITAKGAHTIRYAETLPSDLSERKKLEDGLWADFLHNNKTLVEPASDLSIPPGIDIAVPHRSGKPLTDKILQGLQATGVVYVMGHVQYSNSRKPLNYCVYVQYNTGKIGLCMSHN